MPVKRIAIDRNGIIRALQQAAKKLGRQPKRGELPRVAGISASAVFAHFPSLRDALVAAGVPLTQRGMKIPDQELVADWQRVRDKLGRAPNMTEYIRHGRYSVASFTVRFGRWRKLALTLQNPTAIPELVPRKRNSRPRSGKKSQRRKANTPEATGPALELPGAEIPPSSQAAQGQLADTPQPQEPHQGDKAIAMQWATTVPALPGDLAGKRRVTGAVCAMVVNTLMGEEAGLKWQRVMMGEASRAAEPAPLAVTKPGNGPAGSARLNGTVTSGGAIDPAVPVMGPPFHWSPLTNAPVNELGVVFLFGMLAGELGFQVESFWGQYPDCHARRQVQPGKWQRVRIEIEYESRNFALHGHDPSHCDIIVCWRHNWAKCPRHIEVIELSKVLDGVLKSR